MNPLEPLRRLRQPLVKGHPIHAILTDVPAGALPVSLGLDLLSRLSGRDRFRTSALDTFAVEPLPHDSPLRHLDNVILTPHMVGHTQDVFASFPPAAVENITRILRGEPPLYCKNPEVIAAWQRRLANLGP